MVQTQATIQMLRQQQAVAKENLFPAGARLQMLEERMGAGSRTGAAAYGDPSGKSQRQAAPDVGGASPQAARRRLRPSSAGPRMQQSFSEEKATLERQAAALNRLQEERRDANPQKTTLERQAAALNRLQAETRGDANPQQQRGVDFKKVWSSTVPHWGGKVKDQGAAHRIHALDSAIANMERSLLLAKRRSAELTSVRTQPITVQSLARTH